MKNTNAGKPADISFDDFDEINDPRSAQTDLEWLIETNISRRKILGRGFTMGASAFIIGTSCFAAKSARVKPINLASSQSQLIA